MMNGLTFSKDALLPFFLMTMNLGVWKGVFLRGVVRFMSGGRVIVVVVWLLPDALALL